MENITQYPEWQALKAHHQNIANQHMLDWFAKDPSRFSRLSLQSGGLLLDYSKNRITSETLNLLFQLAKKVNLAQKIEALFTGQSINKTEDRPALHTALRNRSNNPVYVNNENVMPLINASLQKMGVFTDKVRSGQWLGVTGKPITDIVNVGIGGSHLGPLSTTHALTDFATDKLRCHFISNVDAAHINEVLRQINPESTLFIISSKSFTTLETLTNANTLKAWLQNALGTNNVSKHFVAVTAAPKKAVEFGIPNEQIFLLWDWVGGRYSVWSAIGLPLALMIGINNFMAFLDGAHHMDEHFRQAEFAFNMPILLGLLGIWYINFFDANNHAIVPYTHHLTHLRTYLQQADMESNGKSISQLGQAIDYATGPIIWGEQGCNAQHAFHQLLHQGQHFIPVDFILVAENENNLGEHHDILVASGLSQAQALLRGKPYQQALEEVLTAGFTGSAAEYLARHKSIPGNRPSNVLFLDKMTPYNLGACLALYEHKIYVQGAIWNINSFDQWGVELGKQLLPEILTDLQNNQQAPTHDASTMGLISHYKKVRAEA